MSVISGIPYTGLLSKYSLNDILSDVERLELAHMGRRGMTQRRTSSEFMEMLKIQA